MFISYSQNFEDVILYRALRSVLRGFYIDIGASHPDIDSVSRAFHEKGWSGIHVEPLPAHAAALCSGQVKQDTLLSRLLIKFPLILNRGLIA